MMRNVLSELVIHLSNPLYLHLPALFSSTPPPPPLSLVTINKEGIRSEFVILTPAQCDINHLISLMGLNVCVFVCEIMNTLQYVQVKKASLNFI